jgi:hypothetical protein
MMDPLRRRHVGDELPIFWRQMAMAEPEHFVAKCLTEKEAE